VLGRLLEEHRPKAIDNYVDQTADGDSDDEREDGIRQLDKNSPPWAEEITAEVSREIGRDERAQPGQLPREAAPPSAQDFQQNQDAGKGNENELPERRSG
jgi:hypothetical protein